MTGAFRFHTTLRPLWSEAYAEVPQLYRDRAVAASRSGSTTIYAGQNDLLWLPAQYAAEFGALLRPFDRHAVFHEVRRGELLRLTWQVVFHTIYRFFEPEPAYNMPDDAAKWLWLDERDHLEEELTPSTFALHPTKMSNVHVVDVVRRWLVASREHWRRS